MPKIAAPLVNLCTVFLLFATTEQGSIYWIFIIRSVEKPPCKPQVPTLSLCGYGAFKCKLTFQTLDAPNIFLLSTVF